MLIKRLAHQGLDDCLTANIQAGGSFVKLFQHRSGQVEIDALNWLNYPPFPVKNFEMSLPSSAIFAMASAGTGLLVLAVFFIDSTFFRS